MSDKFQKLTVILEKETDSEGVDHFVKTIQAIRGVRKVTADEVMGIEAYMARQTVLTDFIILMYQFLSEANMNTEAYTKIRDILEAAKKRR